MRFLTFLALMFLAMVISGLYGALHDQVSYTVSPEYFTEFKFHQFGLIDSPLGERMKAAMVGWMATWWMGVPIGVLVGGFGYLHPTCGAMFHRSMIAFGVVAVVAMATGLLGLAYGTFVASQDPADYVGFWYLPESLTEPARFLRVGHMHNFSYLGGVIGLVAGVITQFVLRRRGKRQA